MFADTSELEGTIVGFSDSGGASRVFALVEVVQRRTVVVPVENLRPSELQSNRSQQCEET